MKNLDTKRTNYMSLTDKVQDLTNESLINLLPTVKTLKDQMIIMSQLEVNEICEDLYFDLLETCNGI
jgi:hypothetical protein|tara:strand:- start:710 stop:910 length:201 start_codon:yes stop_codon:yes gene_type:complete